MKRNRRIIIILLVLCLMMPTYACSSNDATTINTMSFNMRYETKGDPEDLINKWDNRKKGIVKALKDYDVSILGTQELEPWQHSELLKLLGSKWASVGLARDAQGESENNNILYRKDRIQCIEWTTIWLSETPEVAGSKSWNASTPRILTFGKFLHKKSKTELYFFNTHLDHRSENAKIYGLELVLKQMDRFSDYPRILTGDFNANIYSSILEPLATSETFSDTLTPFEEFYGKSLTAHNFNGGTDGVAIDYIFFSVSHFELIKTEIVRTRYQDKYWLSDHYPVYSQLKLIEGEK